MSRPLVLIVLAGALSFLAFWLLLQSPGSLNEALARPFEVLVGTGHDLNSKLLEVSETSETVLAAGRRLLQPLGIVRLVRIYEAPDTDSTKKR